MRLKVYICWKIYGLFIPFYFERIVNILPKNVILNDKGKWVKLITKIDYNKYEIITEKFNIRFKNENDFMMYIKTINSECNLLNAEI